MSRKNNILYPWLSKISDQELLDEAAVTGESIKLHLKIIGDASVQKNMLHLRVFSDCLSEKIDYYQFIHEELEFRQIP